MGLPVIQVKRYLKNIHITTVKGDGESKKMEWMCGKHALITGASSGVGSEVARRLMGTCRKITLISRTPKNDETHLDGCKETEIDEAFMDISDPDGLDTIIHHIYKHDQVDAFINCAGGTPVIQFFEEMTPETIVEIINVNTIAPILWLRELLPRMAKNNLEGKKRAHILMMSSRSAERALPRLSVYAAAKAGVDRFIEAMQREYAVDHIAFTLVSPGSINTNFTKHWPAGDRDWHNAESMTVEEAVDPIIQALNAEYATNRISYESTIQWTREMGALKKERKVDGHYGLRS